MQGCTYPSVLIDDLYKTNHHFSPVIMAACDPYVHLWHTPEIITTISNTWSATHRMYITQGVTTETPTPGVTVTNGAALTLPDKCMMLMSLPRSNVRSVRYDGVKCAH